MAAFSEFSASSNTVLLIYKSLLAGNLGRRHFCSISAQELDAQNPKPSLKMAKAILDRLRD